MTPGSAPQEGSEWRSRPEPIERLIRPRSGAASLRIGGTPEPLVTKTERSILRRSSAWLQGKCWEAFAFGGPSLLVRAAAATWQSAVQRTRGKKNIIVALDPPAGGISIFSPHENKPSGILVMNTRDDSARSSVPANTRRYYENISLPSCSHCAGRFMFLSHSVAAMSVHNVRS